MTSAVSLKLVGVTVVILSKQTVKTVEKNFLLPKSGNFLVCPVSLEALLALVQIGANGETAKQIALGLNHPIDRKRVLDVYSMVYPLRKVSKNYIVETSRKMYINNGFNISERYKNYAVNSFRAEVENINLLDTVKTISEINKWLNSKTHNSIGHNLLTNGLNKGTQMILLNVVYLQGLLATGFQQNMTLKKKFFIDNQRFTEVDMLEVISDFNYYENLKLKAKFLEISCEGGKTTLTIVLPNAVDGLQVLENYISQIVVTPKYRRTAVHTWIPKIELNFIAPFNNILKALGIVKPFQNDADFSLISEQNEHRLKIDGVWQEIYTSIEDSGRADDVAFNTAITRRASVQEYATFHADHPFVFYVKNKGEGVTFMGRFTKAEGTIRSGSFENKVEDHNN